MSVEVMGWAWRQRLESATRKIVLLALADHADDDGNCWPGQKGLAEKCELDTRTVRRALHQLEKAGLIRVRKIRGERGRWMRSIYVLAVYQGTLEPADTGSAGQSVRRTESPSPPDSESVHHRTESPLKRQTANVNGTTKKKQKQFSADFETWLSHYHATTGRTDVRGSQAARQQFAARRREGRSVDDLKLATEGCHGDEFCRTHKHDVPETILRASKIERYILLAREPRRGKLGELVA